MDHIQATVDYFSLNGHKGIFRGINRGIEKESLRIAQNGALSEHGHPKKLGSALTHRYVTTDFSEALLELITPASDELLASNQWLHDIHRFIYHNIGDEMLWATSMPCLIGSDASIPVAQYGHSNAGKMKTIYRIGLGHRYGRVMQTIAGVHYNFSMPTDFWPLHQMFKKQSGDINEFIAEQYFALLRNFHRHGWIISYLYGASPALCESFLSAAKVNKINLTALRPGTLCLPFGTSLRMSDIGYSNNAQSKLNIGYNSLKSYLRGLNKAINSPEPLYEKIGVLVDSEYRQLSANLLQIENEYYSAIRPKQTTRSGERPTTALMKRGVEYIEVRSLDINPFSAIGISDEQSAFLDCFILYCLFASSPKLSLREQAEASENHRRVVEFGRKPDLVLRKNNRDICIQKYAEKIFSGIKLIAEKLDAEYETHGYRDMLRTVEKRLSSPEQTLSGQIITALTDKNDNHYVDGSFFGFAKHISELHRDFFLSKKLDPEKNKYFEQESLNSFAEQKAMEADDSLTFEAFLANYYNN